MTDQDAAFQNIIKAITSRGSAKVVELAGEIDMQCSMDLRASLLELLREKPTALVVDMTHVEFMDSSGLATLVEALQWSRRHGGKLKLVGLQPRVRSVFEISQLETIFEIYDSVDEALPQ